MNGMTVERFLHTIDGISTWVGKAAAWLIIALMAVVCLEVFKRYLLNAPTAWIFEDDYDSEFRFGGRPIEPLQSLDRSGRVLYVGSFSKVMLPTLRLGFLITPPSLVDALRGMRYVTDWHTPLAEQAALA